MGLPMGGVGTSDPPSEVPMEQLILAESILSEFTWDFQHRSEVPIKDRKFRHFENQPKKR